MPHNNEPRGTPRAPRIRPCPRYIGTGYVPSSPEDYSPILSEDYIPQVAVMSTGPNEDHGLLPDRSMLVAARARAEEIRELNHKDPIIEDLAHIAINQECIPGSAELKGEANEDNTANSTYFDDFLVAEMYRNALRPTKIFVDETIPTTPPAIKAHVTLLVRAFNSHDAVDDNPGMIRPFEELRHDSKMVEMLCWNLVKACIYRSKSDEPLLASYDPSKSKNAAGLETFAKRYDNMVMAMARSKTICKHLHDAPYMNTFVDDPMKSVRRVDANRELNKQKADTMHKGKQAEGKETEGNELKSNGTTPGTRSARKRNVSTALSDDDDYEFPARVRIVTPSKSRVRNDQAARRTPLRTPLRRGRSSQLVADVDGTSSPLAITPQSNDSMVGSPLSTESYLYSTPQQGMTSEHSSGSDGYHANASIDSYGVKPEKVSPPQSQLGDQVATGSSNGSHSASSMQQAMLSTANGINWNYAQQYHPAIPSSTVNMSTSTMPSMQSYYQAPQAQLSNTWSTMYRRWLSDPSTAFRIPGQQMMVPQDIVATPVSSFHYITNIKGSANCFAGVDGG